MAAFNGIRQMSCFTRKKSEMADEVKARRFTCLTQLGKHGGKRCRHPNEMTVT